MPTDTTQAAQPAAPAATIHSAVPITTSHDVLAAAAAKAMAAVAPKEPAPTEESSSEEAPVEASSQEAPPEAVDPPAAKPEPKVPNLLQRLREREQAFKLKQQDKPRESRQDYELEHLRSEARRELDAAKAERSRIEKLRSDPFEAIKELGWNTQDLVNGVVKRGTPEYEAQQKLIAIQAEADKRIAKLDELTKLQEQREESFRNQQDAQKRETNNQTFLTHATDKESFSALNTLYKPHEILRMAREIQTEYSRRTGDLATDADLSEYMNEQAQVRLEEIRQSLGESGTAPKVDKAKGSRALSNSAASETRSTSKPINRASTEDRLAAMERAAADAMRKRA